VVSGGCRVTVTLLSGHCQGTVSPLSGYCQATVTYYSFLNIIPPYDTYGSGLRDRIYRFYEDHCPTKLPEVNERLAAKWEAAAINEIKEKFPQAFVNTNRLTHSELLTMILESDELSKELRRHMDSVFKRANTRREPTHSGDLFDVLWSHRVVPREKLSVIFTSLCQTLVFLHSEKVVHRDLKPENMMVVEDRSIEETAEDDGEGRVCKKIILRDRMTVKVVDYGLAKVLPNHGFSDAPPDFLLNRGLLPSGSQVVDVTPCGTHVYSAFEALKGFKNKAYWYAQSDTLPKLDVWSAGVILYAMYYGEILGGTMILCVLPLIYTLP